jgi:hypothetical protein
MPSDFTMDFKNSLPSSSGYDCIMVVFHAVPDGQMAMCY